MILLIDNYDSFVHNLARYVRQLGYPTQVIRNDETNIAEINALAPEKIILSPGPCDPDKAGISLEVVNVFGAHRPILGVCLGHQVIGQAYGGRIVRANRPMHGKASLITHTGQDIFNGLPSPYRVGRYHSLVVDPQAIPDTLTVLATSEDGEIMALRHNHFPVYGVQFHPESINTEHGYALLANFLKQPYSTTTGGNFPA